MPADAVQPRHTAASIQEELDRLQRALEAYEQPAALVQRQQVRFYAVAESGAPAGILLPVDAVASMRAVTPERDVWVWDDDAMSRDGYMLRERQNGTQVWQYGRLRDA